MAIAQESKPFGSELKVSKKVDIYQLLGQLAAIEFSKTPEELLAEPHNPLLLNGKGEEIASVQQTLADLRKAGLRRNALRIQ